jgi:hypothetical protein
MNPDEELAFGSNSSYSLKTPAMTQKMSHELQDAWLDIPR